VTWLLTLLSLVGTVLNIRQHRACFIIWAATNISWAVVDWQKQLYAQSALFAVYFGFSIWGIIAWRKKKAT
jgi:nicotinamide riboside transporter PnuC